MTVWICPVTVSIDVTGVGVHVEELEDVDVDDGEVWAKEGVGVVAGCCVVGVSDVD